MVPSCTANGIRRQRGAAASREAATKIHTKPKIHRQSTSWQLKPLFLPPEGISTPLAQQQEGTLNRIVQTWGVWLAMVAVWQPPPALNINFPIFRCASEHTLQANTSSTPRKDGAVNWLQALGEDSHPWTCWVGLDKARGLCSSIFSSSCAHHLGLHKDHASLKKTPRPCNKRCQGKNVVLQQRRHLSLQRN